jgi:hypothetical protein
MNQENQNNEKNNNEKNNNEKNNNGNNNENKQEEKSDEKEENLKRKIELDLINDIESINTQNQKINISTVINQINPRKKIKLHIQNPNKDEDEHDPSNTPRVRYFCENNMCDHKKYSSKWMDNNKVELKNINTINDLIKLGKYYHCRMRKTYNGIDLKILLSISPYLNELNDMIGLSNIKEEIVNMVIYLLLMKNSDKGLNSDMLHAVVTGSPGCGKTTFIEIISKIYTKLGVLKKGHIVKAKRSDLIGKYLGHTAVQTQQKINEAKGGILLIDEAYSLGNPEGRDSFSKECLDTLNQALSEDKSEFICIIAGYKNALDSSFFNYNEGLRRRFPFRFDISAYKSEELSLILMKKIKEYNYWDIDFKQEQLDKQIKDNFKYFENQGGDMESLFLNLKIVHNKRVFLLSIEEKKKLIIGDIKESIDKFLKLKGDYFKNKHETPFGLYV